MNERDLILHHYEMSPFSQKIRSMLGYCYMNWYSVLSPAMPPRPNLDPLTGGYRKIPVLQIGADLFCDTRVITAEISALSGNPRLDRDNCKEEVQAFVDDVDLRVFFASAGSSQPAKALTKILKSSGPIGTLKFVKDRMTMMKSSKVPMPTGGKAQQILVPHYRKLEKMLMKHPFLHGEQPGIADFSAYHVAWLGQLTGANPFTTKQKKSIEWYQQISDFGEGERSEIEPENAFAIAEESEPRALPEEFDDEQHIGLEVTIAPADYARDPVTGTLMATTPSRWIIKRETEEFGTLHVHFPRSGFDLKPG